MFFNQSPVQEQQHREKQLHELQIQMDALESSISAIYHQLGISPEELDAVLQKSELFQPHEWEEMQRFRQEIDKQLS